jgi:tetratricopeptide (TPR) repeat protein
MADGGSRPDRPDEVTGDSDSDIPRASDDAEEGTPVGAADGGGAADEAVEDAYDWYTRGLELLDAGSAAAAAQLLERASAAEPDARSILEALGRAQFRARDYQRAKATFGQIIEANPADDYAQFALGLCAARTGDLRMAVEHLALAVAMRPDAAHYGRELRMARARLQGAT